MLIGVFDTESQVNDTSNLNIMVYPNFVDLTCTLSRKERQVSVIQLVFVRMETMDTEQFFSGDNKY